MPAKQPLSGQVALVAGATRGAGRGIARGLGEAGATVYCTGRSVAGHRSPYNRPETIDETARDGDGGRRHRHRRTRRSYGRARGRGGVRPRRPRPRPPRRARQQHRRRGSPARRMGKLLADRFHPRRRRPAPVDPLAPHHRQACGALHAQTPPRPHRRGDRGRHGVWRRRQRARRRREELAQGFRRAHGWRTAHASRRRRVHYARVPAIRVDAGALRRHGGQLARRRQEGPELPRIRIAAVCRPRGGCARRRPEDPRALGGHPELVGTGARLRLHGLRWPPPGLGCAVRQDRAGHRFPGAIPAASCLPRSHDPSNGSGPSRLPKRRSRRTPPAARPKKAGKARRKDSPNQSV